MNVRRHFTSEKGETWWSLYCGLYQKLAVASKLHCRPVIVVAVVQIQASAQVQIYMKVFQYMQVKIQTMKIEVQSTESRLGIGRIGSVCYEVPITKVLIQSTKQLPTQTGNSDTIRSTLPSRN